MEYIKVNFPHDALVIINRADSGPTNKTLPIGDPGWYWISVKWDNRQSHPIGLKIKKTSDLEPQEVEFEIF